MKYVIIGGVAGGATAAARLRRVDEMAEILLLEKGPYISYANCGLPYYIGGVIAEREKLLVQTPESFGKRFRIDVRVQNEVIAIHPKNKTVTIRNVEGKEYDESYDKLLLSPGANPVKPPLEGINSEGIFTLRNVEDTDHIKAYISDKQVKYSENTEVNRYRFKGKRIVPVVGIPEHTMVLGEFSTGMDSNLWMGVDYANDAEVLKVDRLQSNSELFFFQMRMKMDVNIVKPAEIVVHTAYTKTA